GTTGLAPVAPFTKSAVPWIYGGNLPFVTNTCFTRFLVEYVSIKKERSQKHGQSFRPGNPEQVYDAGRTAHPGCRDLRDRRPRRSGPGSCPGCWRRRWLHKLL